MLNQNFLINPFLYHNLFNHVCLLQQKYSRLMPIRMDFAFKAHSVLGQQRNQDLIVSEMYLLAERLIEEEFIVGYQWVPEYAPDTGLHFHAVFYANAHRFISPHAICNRAVQLWDWITQGQGRFYDCDLRASEYKTALSVLNYSRHNSYQTLMYVISYLAKQDQKILNFDYQPVFYVSDVLPPSTRGRKRSRPSANLHRYLPDDSFFAYEQYL